MFISISVTTLSILICSPLQKKGKIHSECKNTKKNFNLAFVSQIFYISLQKISFISAKYSSKLDILHSICIIFAEDKLHLSKIFK